MIAQDRKTQHLERIEPRLPPPVKTWPSSHWRFAPPERRPLTAVIRGNLSPLSLYLVILNCKIYQEDRLGITRYVAKVVTDSKCLGFAARQ